LPRCEGVGFVGPTEKITPETVEAMRDFGLATIAAGHCTGWRAIAALTNAFRDKIVTLTLTRFEKENDEIDRIPFVHRDSHLQVALEASDAGPCPAQGIHNDDRWNRDNLPDNCQRTG
jgi:hypothetical protein